MNLECLEWKDEYGIGIEAIDNDHKQLFMLTRRLYSLSQQANRGEFAAQESIKFLKKYTVEHFHREEEYMRSINYKNYEQHLGQHIHMREVILPGIERHMRTEKYSPQALEKFVNIMRLWLARHILSYDKGIGLWKNASAASI